MRRWDKNSRVTTIIDQVINSASNFLAVALVANAASTEFFGQFSIAYAALIFFLGAQRALIGETLIVHYSDGVAGSRSGLGSAIGASFACGLASLACLMLPVFFVASDSRLLWILMACGAVPVLLQDSLRYLSIVRRDSAAALVLDLIWTVPAVIGMLIGVALGAPAETVIEIWLGAATLSMLWGLVQTGSAPSLTSGIRWLSHHRSSALRYFAEFAGLNASTFLVWILLVPAIGIAGVGALRGAQLLFSPLNTAFNSVRLAVVPELIRARRTSKFRRQLIESAGVLGAICIAWSLLIIFMTDSVGALILGETWAEASKLTAEFSAQYVALAAYTVLLVLFRSLPLNVAATKMRAWLAGATLAFPLLLAAFCGTSGAAWGFALAALVGVLAGLAVCLQGRNDSRSEDFHKAPRMSPR